MSRAPSGVTVAGFLRETLGLGEAARRVAAALRHGGHEVDALGVLTDVAARRTEPDGLRRVAPDEARELLLLCLSPDALAPFVADVGAARLAVRTTIALWWWEVGPLPPAQAAALAPFDVLWAGSEHVAGILERGCGREVRRIVVPVAAPVGGAPVAPPAGPPRFLTTFDHNSSLARKNPLGTIEAFRRAFPDGGAALVVKTVNGGRHPEARRVLRDAVGDDPRIELVEQALVDSEQYHLLASSTCYVSLHRAEGLGLPLADAMAFGRPVVATGWSGNLDFMHAGNAHLVDHRFVPVGEGDHGYDPDGLWAEPDLDHAAGLLRAVADEPDAAAALGRRAAEEVGRTRGLDAAARSLDAALPEPGAKRGAAGERTGRGGGAAGARGRTALRRVWGRVGPALPDGAAPALRRLLPEAVRPSVLEPPDPPAAEQHGHAADPLPPGPGEPG